MKACLSILEILGGIRLRASRLRRDGQGDPPTERQLRRDGQDGPPTERQLRRDGQDGPPTERQLRRDEQDLQEEF
jgi:hypothetical protein